MAIINTALPDYLNDIKNARINRGYNQREMAKLCVVTHTHYNKVETGNAVLSMRLFIKIADVLELKIRLTA